VSRVSPRVGLIPSSIVSKAAVAVVAFAVALASVAWLAVRATDDATSGAVDVETEFAERVSTDAAMQVAHDNFRLAHFRMRAADAREARALDRKLDRSDAKLNAAIGTALAPNDFKGRERGVVNEIRAAFPAYLTARERIVSAPGGPRAIDTEANRNRLRRAFDRLQAAQEAFGASHFASAGRDLQALRAGTRWRTGALTLALVFGLLSLLGLLLLVRRVAVHVREYAAFAGQVAGGDLSTRLQARRRDELAGLAHSLNAMVEELATAAQQRKEALAGDRAYRAAQDAFSDAMQVAATEREAHGVLKLHIERWVPHSEVVVLNRDSVTDRLEATTPLPDGSPLDAVLEDAEPRACLAVRLARTHDSAADPAPLLECELCGLTPAESTCVPLSVSGEVIGSVLVEHARMLHADEHRRIEDTVSQAGPTLANLRNLALAEARAATDSLTGLPNRRAVQEALKRMIAQAGRTLAPMSVLLLDLDHFKQINDTYGHDRGDAVLTAVGEVLASALRTSDFVGRNGGEEFVALLPDTGVEGAMEAAEKLRAAIGRLTLPGIDRPVTASVGAAVYPHTAADAESLLRLADRALYAAKAGGRNRSAMADTPVGV
jgi:diguanylate cyclase (GGDEF)-like protein